MKQTALLISFLFFGAPAFSQIGTAEEIGKSWETIGMGIKLLGYPKLSKTKVGDKDYYSIFYRNLEYQQLEDYKSFYFFANPDELEYLYDALQKGGHKKETTSIDVGEGRITVRKNAASIMVNVYHPPG